MSKHSEDFHENASLFRLIHQAGSGSEEAENQLAQFFFTKAIVGTRQKLNGVLSKEDQEDIALSAVMSFCMGIRKGRIRYQGDQQLFALLKKFVDGKIRKLWQFLFAQKRDIRQVEALEDEHLEEMFYSPVGDQGLAESIHVTPEEQPIVDRILENLQSELHGLFSTLISELDEHPRKLLLVMLETDATNEELAEKIGRSVASIDRYRNLIRHKIKELQQRRDSNIEMVFKSSNDTNSHDSES